QLGAFGGLVDVVDLVVGRNDADRDSVVALADEIFEIAVLFFGLAVGRHLDVHLHAGFLLIFVHARGGDFPELAGVVGDKSQLEICGIAVAARFGVGAILAAARNP